MKIELTAEEVDELRARVDRLHDAATKLQLWLDRTLEDTEGETA